MTNSSFAPTRRVLIRAPFAISLLAMTRCADDDAPQSPPAGLDPLRFDYLSPIRLNVASIEIEDRFVPAGSGADVTALAPVRPADALRQMAQDRLQALGPSGRARFVIKDAALMRAGGSYQGRFTAELDIFTLANTPAAFAEATVTRAVSADGGDARQTLYDLVKQLMEAMNVEFEFQVRRNLKEWLVPEASAAPGPVEQQPLSSPPRPPS